MNETDSFLRVGPRVILRDWRMSDLPAYHHWGQPGHQWQQWDAPYEAVWSPEDVDARIAQLEQQIAAASWTSPRRRVVIALRETDEFLGTVSWYWRSQACVWLEMGIGLYDPDRWGQGLGSAAMSLWCEYLWEAFPQAVRLGFSTWSGNLGMVRVAQKLGMVQEACYRRARVVQGRYYDSVSYGILREEWESNRARKEP